MPKNMALAKTESGRDGLICAEFSREQKACAASPPVAARA